MLDTIEGISLLSIMEIVGPALLALGLIYGGMMAANRRKSGVSDQQRDDATRRVYRQEEDRRVREHLD